MLLGFKLGEQFFCDTGLNPVAGGGIPYGRSVSDKINESKIYSRRRHDDKVGVKVWGELGPSTAVSLYKDYMVVGPSG